MPTIDTKNGSDLELLQHFAGTGDEKSFATLMRRHWSFVFATTRRALYDSALAEDAAQQTFIALAKQAGKLRKDRPLGPWLYRAARLEASNLLKREQRQRRRNQQYNELATKASQELDDSFLKIHQGLASLSKSDRELIILRYYQNFTSEQIARHLGISNSAAQKRTHRALEKLSALLRDEHADSQKFGMALPALLAPESTMTKSAIAKVLQAPTTSTGLLVPAASWILATTFAVAGTHQIIEKRNSANFPEPSSLQETVSRSGTPRRPASPPEPSKDPNVAHFLQLAETSPATALIWAREKFPAADDLERFLKKSATHLAPYNLQLAKDILHETEGDIPRRGLICGILKHYAQTDFVEGIRWVDSLSPPFAAVSWHQLEISNTFLQLPFEEALAVAKSPKTRTWLIRALCEQYERMDETKIHTLAKRLPDKESQQVLRNLARILLDRDDPRSADIIQEIEGQFQVNERATAKRCPSRYLDAIHPRVTDRSDNWFTASRILNEWYRLDPKAAKQWSADHDPGNQLKLEIEPLTYFPSFQK